MAEPNAPSAREVFQPASTDEGAPVAEPSSTDIAAAAPTGSSRARACGTGSHSGSGTGSAAVCRVIPLLRDLVRELVRLAPRPVSPCPCPDRAR
ncbi:hypothetical protein ACWCPQ_18675 [Nocardia sp. NPDC001965]